MTATTDPARTAARIRPAVRAALTPESGLDEPYPGPVIAAIWAVLIPASWAIVVTPVWLACRFFVA